MYPVSIESLLGADLRSRWGILFRCPILPSQLRTPVCQFIQYKSQFVFTKNDGFSIAQVRVSDGIIDFSVGLGLVFDRTWPM
jgi:hypothetical protein